MNIHHAKLSPSVSIQTDSIYLEKLRYLLSQDMDFHNQDTGYASHNFHSFPAKFPPQLPREFIQNLTSPGDIVLDPMMGSGTTLLEAFLLGRQGIGFDIDPLALLLSRTKTTSLDLRRVAQTGNRIIAQARQAVIKNQVELKKEITKRWDLKTQQFVDYWFDRDTQTALLSLLIEIKQIQENSLRAFFELVFSAIIITKSGGVSLALDLAHTRPHRARIVVDQNDQFVLGTPLDDQKIRHPKFATKKLRSPFEEFEKRVAQNLKGLPQNKTACFQYHLDWIPEAKQMVSLTPVLASGSAQCMPLGDDSVDIVITSPPYASNAIDYMRAHKFSLVWFGYSIDSLGEKRQNCIGGETTSDFKFEKLPRYTSQVVDRFIAQDKKKGKVLHRYYSEMTCSLREMFRVLKPGKAAIVVVGSSVMRGIDTETQTCLSEIGQTIGFQVPGIGIRAIDRNRRMMPAGTVIDLNSQIQQRLHKEYIIGFYKPNE